jgi:2-methylcitrate dehydratase
VERVEIEIFEVAYNIIGGGEEGEKKTVRTKEEADHSLPYMLAVVLLDGEVYPAQYEPRRIAREDVQSLLRRVEVRPADDLSARFPQEIPAKVQVSLRDGRSFEVEKRDYEGFFTRPISWERELEKFERLAAPYADVKLRDSMEFAVGHMEDVDVGELAKLLGKVGTR